MLEDYIKPQIDKLPMEPIDAKQESPEQATVRLAMACCIVCLLMKYKLKYDYESTCRICSALLLRPDCVDYAQVTASQFPSEAGRG